LYKSEKIIASEMKGSDHGFCRQEAPKANGKEEA
jgi:hypothetical protein